VFILLAAVPKYTMTSYSVSWWRQHGWLLRQESMTAVCRDYCTKNCTGWIYRGGFCSNSVFSSTSVSTTRRHGTWWTLSLVRRWRLCRVDSVFVLPDVTTWLYQGTGLQRTDVALSSLLDRQLGMTCPMNCVTFLFLGLLLEVVLKLIFLLLLAHRAH